MMPGAKSESLRESFMIWGCFCWSGLGSVTIGGQKINNLADYLNLANHQVLFSLMDLFSCSRDICYDNNIKLKL